MNRAVYDTIRALADKHMAELNNNINSRIKEMENDDNSHYLLYRVLGVSDDDEGAAIDRYQNTGRFLYNHAGIFLEKAAFICMQHKYPEAKKTQIPNTHGNHPKNFEIDCLIGKDAHEIKWRDATTDGDHINKERTRIEVIKGAGYTPIRIMFYYPQRPQAQKIQKELAKLYENLGGKYYCDTSAWDYIKNYTEIDLLEILEQIASSRSASTTNAVHF